MDRFVMFSLIIYSLLSAWICLLAAADTPDSEAIAIRNISENEVHSFGGFQGGLTLDDLPLELRNWTPPEFFSKNYPCYLSGFDFEDRPIWIAELGKYDMQKLVNMGPEVLKEFEKYCKYAGRIWTDSHTLKSPDVHSLSLVLDFEGLRLIQFAQLPTLSFLLKLARDYFRLLDEHIDFCIVINANYVTETLISIVKPVLGNIFARTEFYGTDRKKWLPRMLRHFPPESLPEWYGGYKNFTPIKIIG